MPRYWDACRTFITSRDSLTRNAHLDRHTPFSCYVFAAPLTARPNAGHRYPGCRLVRPLCHRGLPSVKPFSTAVVLRMSGILGNSPVIVGTLDYKLWMGFSRTTIACGFCRKPALSNWTVILCSQLAKQSEPLRKCKNSLRSLSGDCIRQERRAGAPRLAPAASPEWPYR